MSKGNNYYRASDHNDYNYYSTPVGHAFGLTGAVELARRLHRLPPVVVLYGIVGKCFDLGTGLSDCVVRSIPELMQRIEKDIQAPRAA